MKKLVIVLWLAMGYTFSVSASTDGSELRLLYSQQKYNLVIEQADKTISNNKAVFDTYYYKGLAERSLCKYSQAIKSLEQALVLDSLSYPALSALADSYEQSGNDPEAMAIYTKQILLDTTNIPPKANLARLYKSQKEYGNAIELYGKLVELDTTNGYYYAQLGYCCSKYGITQPVIYYYTKALTLNSFNLETGKLLINELIDQKLYDDANYYIDTLLVQFTDNLYLLKQRAYILALGANYLDAVRAFERVVNLGDSSMFTCKFYGQSLYNNGQYAEAVFWLGKYLENNRDDTKNQFIMGLACQKDYRYEKSIDHLNIALEQLYNKDLISRVFEETGNTFLKYGDYVGFRDSTGTKAVEKYTLSRDQYLTALEIQPTNFDIYRILAGLYETKFEDTQMALYYYQKYYNNLDTNKIDVHQLEWIQATIKRLKEELHFKVD